MSRFLSGKKVLVTGGAGFIGSNLIESLLEHDNIVTCLDNFSTGRRSNIENFLTHPSFTLIEGDIRDYETCQRALNDAEYVFHQAALGSVPRSLADPVTTTDVNIGGFVKVLFAAKEAGVKRLIYAASSSTYGDHPDLPKVEEKIGNPLSPYAITKYVDELYANVFASAYNMELIGLRYFNVFGRNQDPDSYYAAVIPLFIRKLFKHERPVINGDGTISRDFTYIDNVVTANHLAAVTDNQEAINQVYNVAHGERTTLNELFYLIRENAALFDASINKIEPVYGPPRKGDIQHSQASVAKAGRLLGYKPDIKVNSGIERTVKWFRETMER